MNTLLAVIICGIIILPIIVGIPPRLFPLTDHTKKALEAHVTLPGLLHSY